ncbi:transcriptional regulator [Companilactobacillus sp. RD055328]|uniref:hypothetical protein n=1 Tax=Companilactobacillus sp. RD055328 TaxID=2916634 RepID=UPI001FC7DEC7|nr:hypothetical protein [Companilactobacillus sp. RD055328]GKQ43242.1 transcriptional regulator [Companilactobacillus sp. RD055328]
MIAENSLLDLLTPAQAAEELNVNVTTLRKYSLLVEKVTGNEAFFARKNNKRRNYTRQNILDFKKMLEISQREAMTLELAAAEVYDGQLPDQEIAEVVTEGMSGTEKKLNEKIAKQAKEIMHLRKQLKDSQQENYALIRALKNSQETPLFDYDLKVNEKAIAPKTIKNPSQATENMNSIHQTSDISNKTQENKDSDDKYAQALARAKEIRDQKKQLEQKATVVEDTTKEKTEQQNLRTLANMQLTEGKKKWWQR